MQLANLEAQRFNHEYIGTEHILLGLLREGSGVAVELLTNLGLDRRRIILEVERLVQRGPEMVSLGKPPQMPRAKKIIEYAIEESRNLKHDYIGTEHILLALLREDDGVAGVILGNFGLRIEALQKEIENLPHRSPDWGRMPSLKQFPTQWAAQAGKSVAELPMACPKCGHAPVVRVIWRWSHLFGKNLEDATSGKAILGSQSDEGPPWVCLQCAPAWSEVHRLALRIYELQVEKENAIASTDFGKAAQCRDAQVDLRRRLALLFDELSQTP